MADEWKNIRVKARTWSRLVEHINRLEAARQEHRVDIPGVDRELSFSDFIDRLLDARESLKRRQVLSRRRVQARRRADRLAKKTEDSSGVPV